MNEEMEDFPPQERYELCEEMVGEGILRNCVESFRRRS